MDITWVPDSVIVTVGGGTQETVVVEVMGFWLAVRAVTVLTKVAIWV